MRWLLNGFFRGFVGFCFVLVTAKAFAQDPKLVLPIGHTDQISRVCFSPDGRYVVTASSDGTARIWEAETGMQLTVLKGHTSFVVCAAFSPDGKYIVTASWDRTAKIWETATGTLKTTLVGHTGMSGTGVAGWVHEAFFSPDGNYIVTASEDSTARIWDVKTGSTLAVLRGHKDEVRNVRFSPDGKHVVTAARDGTARVWEVARGNLKFILYRNARWSHPPQFSPNGRFIVQPRTDSTAQVWDIATGTVTKTLRGHTGIVHGAFFSPDGKQITTTSADKTARIWDLDSGAELAVLRGHASGIHSAVYAPDGKKILTVSQDHSARLWNAEKADLLAILKGHNGFISNASFSPDGTRLVTGSYDKTARIWETSDGSVRSVLSGTIPGLQCVGFSPDRKIVLTAAANGMAFLWSLDKGILLSTLTGHTGRIVKAHFSADGRSIVTASDDSTARIWDVARGSLQAILKGHSGRLYTAKFSPDGNQVLTTSTDKTARLWNAEDGTLIRTLEGHQGNVWSGVFSPDGTSIVTASDDTTVRRWNARTGAPYPILRGHKSWVFKAVFSPDGKYIVSASRDSTACVWETSSGQLQTVFSGHASSVWHSFFSPKGRYLVTTTFGAAHIWNTGSWTLQAVLKGHSEWVTRASFSPDDKYVLTVSKDKTARIWDPASGNLLKTIELAGPGIEGTEQGVEDIDWNNMRMLNSNNGEITLYDLESGKKMYSFLSLENSDFLVYDQQYRYDGSSGARNLLYFTCGTEVIGLDQVKDQLWVPNLAERIMKKEPVNVAKLSDLNICSLTPLVEELSDKIGTYRYRITPRRGGLGETVLYVNNNETLRFKKNELTPKDGVYELNIPSDRLKGYFIPGRQNPVKIKAYTADNTISSRGLIVNASTPEKETAPPNLYAVMVGVSEYKGEELKLKYAAKDAADLASVIGLSAKKLLNTDGKEHVFIYNLTTAENRYRYPEKMAIKQVLEEIGKKATANDILLIFFAGHGVLSGEADKKQFYFLTAEASSLSATEAVRNVGISTTELSDWIKPTHLKAQKRVLIFDACNSGGAINDLAGKDLAVRNDDRTQQIKAVDKLNEKAGLFVLSAAASNQSAYEMGRYAQGLLTYALLRAVKQQPEILENGKYLNLSRWFNAAVETVDQLSKENGARQEPQLVSNTNFNVGVVDGDVLATVILPAEKPLFTASNFQNSDESISDDDLELSKLVNAQLNDVATRGEGGKILYNIASSSPDAWSLSGRYEVKGSEVVVKVNLKQSKMIKQRFEVSGNKDQLLELSVTIMNRAIEQIK